MTVRYVCVPHVCVLRLLGTSRVCSMRVRSVRQCSVCVRLECVCERSACVCSECVSC